LLRAQSVVSETISKLEEQIGVQLFDRTGRYPKLTSAGSAVLGDARSIIAGVDLLKARAKGMVGWPGAGIVRGDRRLLSDRRDYSSGQRVSAELSGPWRIRIYVGGALGKEHQARADGRCAASGVIGSTDPVIPDTLT